MVGYVASSAIELLNFFSTEEGVKSYTVWGMGDFGGVTSDALPTFAAVVVMGLFLSILLIKPLNALLLGEEYAESMGINTRLTRNCLLLITGLLTAMTTAFCGPISFIGLATPHMARLILGSDNHRRLLPATIFCGAIIATSVQYSVPSAGQWRVDSHQCGDTSRRSTGDNLCSLGSQTVKGKT